MKWWLKATLVCLSLFLIINWTGNWKGKWDISIEEEANEEACQWALDFDGIDDYVNCGNDASLHIIYAITYALWFKRDAATPTHYFFLNRGGTWTDGFSIGALSTDDQFLIGIRTSIRNAIYYNTTINSDVWYHVAVTYNGSIIRFYLDGVNVDSLSAANIIVYSEDSLSVGRENNGSGRWYFPGIIDNVQIYSRALGSTEILWLYNNPCSEVYNTDSLRLWLKIEEGVGDTAFDATANNNDGILGNGVEAAKPAWTEDSP